MRYSLSVAGSDSELTTIKDYASTNYPFFRTASTGDKYLSTFVLPTIANTTKRAICNYNGKQGIIATSLVGAYAAAVASWDDLWSGLSTNYVHYVYINSNDNDLYYVRYNRTANTYTTALKIVALTSYATGGALSIVSSRGGNLYIAYCIDAGAEYGFYKSTDAGLNWSSASNAVWEGATQDQIILMPGFATDNQDIICVFWDASENEISRKLYDNSGNSWGKTSIAGSMIDTIATSYYPNFAAVPDLINSQIMLVAWENVDTAGADLKCWAVSEAAITAKTDVVTSSSDDQVLTSVAINTFNNSLYCFYTGKSDGTDIVGSSMSICFKCSSDGGVTWSDEISSLSTYKSIYFYMTSVLHFDNIFHLYLAGNSSGSTVYNIYFASNFIPPCATFQLGM